MLVVISLGRELLLCLRLSGLCRGSSLCGSVIRLGVTVYYSRSHSLCGLFALRVLSLGLFCLILTVNYCKSLTLSGLIRLSRLLILGLLILCVIRGGGGLRSSLRRACFLTGCLNRSKVRLCIGMSYILLSRLLAACCDLLSLLCAVNDRESLKLSILILLLILFII